MNANVFAMQSANIEASTHGVPVQRSMGNDDEAGGQQSSKSTPPHPAPAMPDTNTSLQSNTASPSTPQWNPKYVDREDPIRNDPPTSPREAAAGASSPEELLRRLSLTEPRPQISKHAPPKSRKRYPGLELSGNVISATFCVPYKVNYGSRGEWVRLGVVDVGAHN